MYEVNPYASPREPSVEARTAPWTPITVKEALRLGAWRGLKWTTYIIGPVAIGMQLMIWGAYAFLYLRGYRRFPPLLLFHLFFNGIGCYLTSCPWGILIGILIGLKRYFVHRIRKSEARSFSGR